MRKALFLAMIGVVASGCLKTLWLKGGKDLNPVEGTPTPVTVWIFQLSDEARFRAASEKIMDEEGRSAELGNDLLKVLPTTVDPGKESQIELKPEDIKAGTRYIGIVANFGTLKGSDWKAVVTLDQVNRMRFNFDGTKITYGPR